VLLAFTAACGASFEGEKDRDSAAVPQTDTDTDSDADTDSDTDSDADTDTDTDGDTDPDPCMILEPLGSAAENREAIQACLDREGRALLVGGTYEIDGTLHVSAASLDGNGQAATLRMTGTPNSLVTVEDDALVQGLRLDANGRVDDTNGAVVHLVGSRSTVRDAWIGDQLGPAAGYHLTGVYFIDASSTGNLVEDVEITNLFYGAIFVAGLPASSANRISGALIHGTQCDGVTFAGYGELVASTLYESGWDCENGPIPGASVYGLANPDGALIQGNAMSDDCGNVLDLDDVQNFVVEDNTLSGPGYQWEGWAPWCTGNGAVLVDSSYNSFERNVVENSGRSNNRVDQFGDPNALFHARGAPEYSDLPDGGDTAIGFVLAQRPGSPGTTVNNSFADNELRAACTAPCVGLGWFASRGTGFDAAGGWSASTTNYFVRNSPYGSNQGSKRCGGNWYAANDTCTGDTWPEGDCNRDDDQHDGGDWARNDDCAAY